MAFLKRHKQNSSHRNKPAEIKGLGKLAIVGSPNVGKSVLFKNLTGIYATVSNYPGTTIEVSRGKGRIGDRDFEVIDTPGMYSLLPITDEERVARDIIINDEIFTVLHVVDAKNLKRMLPLTLQLIEANLPVILVLNIMDEAEKLGIEIDVQQLESQLGIPVVATVSTSGKGIDILKKRIINLRISSSNLRYDDIIELSLEKIAKHLTEDFKLSTRVIGLLLLQEDLDIHNLYKNKINKNYDLVSEIIKETRRHYSYPLNYIITMHRQHETNRILANVLSDQEVNNDGIPERLSRLMMSPITGIPILLLVLYFGIYQFVGVFGAQVLVEFLEGSIFGDHINPYIIDVFLTYIPIPVVQELFVGEYGIFTLGVQYAVALILPIVGTFFLAFSIIEDTGYFPRLAMLIDRLFKQIGLSGRAVIPMTLGFGCDTMATIVSRTLETKKEKVMVTILLALAIPCSAQLGVIIAILSENPIALLIWAFFMVIVFLVIGFLTKIILPGESPRFYMELPPLRLPKISNVLAKTYSRMQWYFFEVFPIFILASILIMIGQWTGLFQLIIYGLTPLINAIGLPDDSATIFLFGFFRRDYGAAGLYDLQQQGLLTGVQMVVAAATLTLFVPCIAQFAIMLKERGAKTAFAIALFIFPFAFIMGGLLNIILTFSKVVL